MHTLLIVLQGEMLFPEGDLLLWCLLAIGHCEGRHELLYCQMKKVPHVRDETTVITSGIAVKLTIHSAVIFKVEVKENDGVLLNPFQC